MNPSIPLLLFCLHLTVVAEETPVIPGATESTPSRSQYFSWINNRNEGATESQTLTNLEFFKWLHDEYGMNLDIYAFDAGAIDWPRTYGTMDSDKFKGQFPRGFKPIYEMAKSFDCRLGVWLGPDGFGDTPTEEKARIDLLAGLCRDYNFELFKMDAVCTQLRPDKRDAFARLMIECRKYSSDLILLNHRLDLGDAKKYATTFLWEGAETYIDVHMTNRSRTGTHNRVEAISRGLVPNLQRLTEDHGVCISSCIDFWDDDLILQAFNRSLILSPEIYGNPWFLRDDEYPKLARIYNLHRRYRDILIKGIVLDEKRYGELAVARGNESTRLVTLRNLGWEPVTRRVKLDASIGFTGDGPVEVRQFHPFERILGTFKAGDEVDIEVQPFRSCLLLVDTKKTGGVGLKGSDYEVVRDVPGKDTIVKVLGHPGETAKVSLVSGGKSFKKATLDGKPLLNLTEGEAVEVSFPGKLDSSPWHRRIGEPKVCAVPTDSEALIESTFFAADNDPLEIRSIRRSGPSEIPQVQKARQAFIEQPIMPEIGILQQYLFDNNSKSVYDALSARKRTPQLRFMRIDLGKLAPVDHLLLECPADGDVQYATVTPANTVEVSADLVKWVPAKLVQDGRNARIECDATQAIRYVRTDLVPAKLAEIRGFTGGKEMDRVNWRMTWLFPQCKAPQKAWSLPFSIDHAAEGSYLTIACNGTHGRDGVWVALRVDGKCVGVPMRAPSYPVNPFENGVASPEKNTSHFIPVTPEMIGKKCEVVVLGMDAKALDFTPDVWLTAYPNPYQQKTLILSE